MTHIRTRFAPSPTGYIHVGAVRTALFAWLLARQAGGQFVLRIEDTDKVREVEGSEQHIRQSLQWLGLNWDESTDIGGPYAPYLQSKRLEVYKTWGQKLVEKGRAYADPYSKDELEAFRDQAKANKKPFLYRNNRPQNPPMWDGSQPLRFKSEPKSYSWHDAVMGDMNSGEESVDDFILIKADGYPTYNFAHIVDDAIMQITHVIRSQEFIASLPNYFNLYEALKITPPVCAIVPYVMAIDGKKKLGKRDGAKDILDYAREGILPEAMLNFLATLGWNDGTEQEIFSIDELVKKFSLERVQKSPARFDEIRLAWLNGQWIRRLELDDLYERTADFWPEIAKNADEVFKKEVLKLMQERLKSLSDLQATNYFFEEPTPNLSLINTNKQLNKLPPERQAELINLACQALEKSDFTPEAVQTTLNTLLETTGEKPGTLFSLIRIYLSWAPFSPQLNDTIALLGKDIVVKRLKMYKLL